MKVKEIMTSSPIILPETTPIKQVASEMKKNDIGIVPLGKADAIKGVVTDRDIATRALANGKEQVTADQIMTKDVITCNEEDDVEEAAKRMADKQIHRLVVLNKDNKACGVVSFGDITRKCQNDELIGETLKSIVAK